MQRSFYLCVQRTAKIPLGLGFEVQTEEASEAHQRKDVEA